MGSLPALANLPMFQAAACRVCVITALSPKRMLFHFPFNLVRPFLAAVARVPNLPKAFFNLLIASVGTEINYNKQSFKDEFLKAKRDFFSTIDKMKKKCNNIICAKDLKKQ